MDYIKSIIKSKLFWSFIISLFLLNHLVSANKESQQDLLGEYYGSGDYYGQDTVKERASSDTKHVDIEKIDIPQEVARKSYDAINNTKADSLIEYAWTLLGSSYSYGKTGPESFDCSGYIFHVYDKFNVDLPRSSRTQAQVGEPLKVKHIKKGDLLFFKSPTAGNMNIGHVGIAIEDSKDGDVKFIHSSSGRGVVIDSLGSRHYGKRFMEARRVLSIPNQ